MPGFENVPRRRVLTMMAAASLAAASPPQISADSPMNIIDVLGLHSTTLVESAVALCLGSHADVATSLPGLTARFPQKGSLAGYAVTSVFTTDADDKRPRLGNLDYWRYVQHARGPKIAVSLDASRDPGKGSSWGRANASIHKALGCRGVVTNGGVRDIDVIAHKDFQVISAHLTTGHRAPGWIEFGNPITIAGATVRPGDIVCADQHGFVIVPAQVVTEIPHALAEIERRSGAIEAYCESREFSPEGLAELSKKLKESHFVSAGAGKE